MIFDLDDNPISAGNISVEESQSKTLTVGIDCRADYFLRADINANLLIEARKLGDSVWVNLESSEIELTPYAGVRTDFEIRITAGGTLGSTAARIKVER